MAVKFFVGEKQLSNPLPILGLSNLYSANDVFVGYDWQDAFNIFKLQLERANQNSKLC